MVLADVVDLLLALAHLVLLLEALQALHRLARRDALDHGTAALVLGAEPRRCSISLLFVMMIIIIIIIIIINSNIIIVIIIITIIIIIVIIALALGAEPRHVLLEAVDRLDQVLAVPA